MKEMKRFQHFQESLWESKDVLFVVVVCEPECMYILKSVHNHPLLAGIVNFPYCCTGCLMEILQALEVHKGIAMHTSSSRPPFFCPFPTDKPCQWRSPWRLATDLVSDLQTSIDLRFFVSLSPHRLFKALQNTSRRALKQSIFCLSVSSAMSQSGHANISGYSNLLST